MFLLGRPLFRGENVGLREGTIKWSDHLLEILQPGMASDVAVGSNWVVGG